MIGRIDAEDRRVMRGPPSYPLTFLASGVAGLLLLPMAGDAGEPVANLAGLPAPVAAALLAHTTAFPGPVTSASAGSHDREDLAVLVGLIREVGSEAPVQGASVRLENTRWSEVSDENGRFVFEGVPAGTYLLVAEHLAFATVEARVHLDDASATYDLEIRMAAEAIELDPISISVMRTGPLVDVYDRLERMRRLGLGHVYDRRDIERAGVTRVTHLVGLVPGARLQPVPGRVWATELRLHARNNCAPSYYIDGIRTPLVDESVDDHVSLTAVEAIEVYRGLASLPGEFADQRARDCGAVAIWTRRGPPGYEPFGWRRLFVLAGFLSMSYMLNSAFF